MESYEIYSVVNVNGVDLIKVPDGSWEPYGTSNGSVCIDGGYKVEHRGRGRPRKKKLLRQCNK